MIPPEQIAEVRRRADELAVSLGVQPGGDVVWHLMRTEHLSFLAAVRMLARLLGVDVEQNETN